MQKCICAIKKTVDDCDCIKGDLVIVERFSLTIGLGQLGSNTEGEMLTAFHIAMMFTFFGQAGFWFGKSLFMLLAPLVAPEQNKCT